MKSNSFQQANKASVALARVARATSTTNLKNLNTTGLTSAQIDAAVFGASTNAQPVDGLQIIDSTNLLLLTRLGGKWGFTSPTMIS